MVNCFKSYICQNDLSHEDSHLSALHRPFIFLALNCFPHFLPFFRGFPFSWPILAVFICLCFLWTVSVLSVDYICLWPLHMIPAHELSKQRTSSGAIVSPYELVLGLFWYICLVSTFLWILSCGPVGEVEIRLGCADSWRFLFYRGRHVSGDITLRRHL